MAKAVIWKCPKCKVEAEIKENSKNVKFKLTPASETLSFPVHRDCELSKPIHKMDFSKLIKVREE